MAEIKVEVCDVCFDRGREVTRWTIGLGSRTRSVALCQEHSQPLIELMGLGTPEKPSRPRKAAAPRKSTVKKSTPRRTAHSAAEAAERLRLNEVQQRKLEESLQDQ